MGEYAMQTSLNPVAMDMTGAGTLIQVAALALACAIVGLAIAVCSPIRGIPKPELWDRVTL
ncbi:hypothetical protein [Bifidobacterium eulemuris]|nr:hypothetical protein [Bifidobacterium eulemuris]QOL33016.1 hypothetical protein BE0216_11655 [Bifidobacterium eulemuris]